MSFWNEVEHFLRKALDEVGDALLVLANKIKPLVIAGAEEIATSALNAVMAEAPKVVSGAVKFDSAVNTVITGLAARGKSVGAAVASAAVQTAYNELSALLNKDK